MLNLLMSQTLLFMYNQTILTRIYNYTNINVTAFSFSQSFKIRCQRFFCLKEFFSCLDALGFKIMIFLKRSCLCL